MHARRQRCARDRENTSACARESEPTSTTPRVPHSRHHHHDSHSTHALHTQPRSVLASKPDRSIKKRTETIVGHGVGRRATAPAQQQQRREQQPKKTKNHTERRQERKRARAISAPLLYQRFLSALLLLLLSLSLPLRLAPAAALAILGTCTLVPACSLPSPRDTRLSWLSCLPYRSHHACESLGVAVWGCVEPWLVLLTPPRRSRSSSVA